tara:strand:+ start:3294 stop:4208 length:915 start_codon:yes stop_codon:yes gene_type:complete
MTDWQKIIDQCNLFWQYPVSTEKQFYVQNNYFPEYLGFPWATVLDKNINLNEVENYIKQNIDPDIEYYTCCQHIRFRELESILFNLNVKKLYTPHKCIGEGRLGDIELLACPLFAVNYEDSTRNSVFKEKDLIEMKRPLLFSFMGGLQPGYLTDIRERIFKMNKKQDVFIENTGGWHFNNIVYTNLQNFEQEENVSIEHKGGTQRYNEVMMNSRFSLCPSGTGPNSIRFWESLAIGTIPVLFSDTLELPHHELWENSIVRVEENKISDLYDILEKITPEEETELKKNCIRIYNFFRFNYRGEKI